MIDTFLCLSVFIRDWYMTHDQEISNKINTWKCETSLFSIILQCMKMVFVFSRHRFLLQILHPLIHCVTSSLPFQGHTPFPKLPSRLWQPGSRRAPMILIYYSHPGTVPWTTHQSWSVWPVEYSRSDGNHFQGQIMRDPVTCVLASLWLLTMVEEAMLWAVPGEDSRLLPTVTWKCLEARQSSSPVKSVETAVQADSLTVTIRHWARTSNTIPGSWTSKTVRKCMCLKLLNSGASCYSAINN